jgi:hypothetical protein
VNILLDAKHRISRHRNKIEGGGAAGGVILNLQLGGNAYAHAGLLEALSTRLPTDREASYFLAQK